MSCENTNVQQFDDYTPDINLQQDYSPIENNLTGQYFYLCKVWGFLKYHHPNLKNGNIDWDFELITKIKELDTGLTKKKYRKLLANFISKAGKIDKTQQAKDSRINLNWLNDTIFLSKNITTLLNNISSERFQTTKNHYAQYTSLGTLSYENEKSYPRESIAQREYRLLLLFRYWNVIKYYYPYLDDLHTQWDKVLYDFIPDFLSQTDEKTFNLLVLKLTKKIEDSHVGVKSKVLEDLRGKYYSNFEASYIDSSIIVTGTRVKNEKSLARRGDKLLSINSHSVNELIDSLAIYISASNKRVLLRDVLDQLFNSNQRFNTINLIREGDTIIINEEFYDGEKLWSQFVSEQRAYAKENAGELISDSIGYVKMDRIFENNQDMSFDWLFPITKGMILDFRCYPHETTQNLIKKFITEDTYFANIIYPNTQNPGSFKINPAKIESGKKDGNTVYRGQVILLVDEKTQSQAEYSVMAFQTVPNSITMGARTSGTDGNTTVIQLPGEIKTKFTGTGVLYPTLKKTQRIGIIPDILVERTFIGIKSGRDEVLENAIIYLNN
mgnify:CR=1 FL=1